MVTWFWIPLIACIILTIVHTYFGIKIVKKGIIFVDLALAQTAALGAIVALSLSLAPGWPTYALSFGFTAVGAALLTLITTKSSHAEAMIGILFVVTSAMSLIILNTLPGASHAISDMLNGQLLMTTPHDLITMSLLYSIVIALIWLTKTTLKHTTTAAEFIFYVALGLVVTSSVAISGILVVFAYLIIPAVGALRLSQAPITQLLIGWSIGIVGSVLGMAASLIWDTPTGASVVCALAIVMLITSGYSLFFRLFRIQGR